VARFAMIAAWLRRRAENFVALLLASMFATFLIQIFFRYLLNLPVGWTVEYVAIAWLWGILFGYAFVIRDVDIIRLDLVYNLAPRNARRFMDIVGGLVMAGVMTWSLPKAIGFVAFMGVERTAYMQLRFDLVFAVYPPFAVAVIVRLLLNVWHAVRGDSHFVNPIEAAGADDRI
jgi:C4-dicarboxylate transporter, DctQ subunit